MNIISIESKNIDIHKLEERLTDKKLSYMFSDFRFCPYIISYKNPDTSYIEIINVNDGFYKHLEKTQNIIQYSNIDDFISNIICMKNNDSLSDSLF